MLKLTLCWSSGIIPHQLIRGQPHRCQLLLLSTPWGTGHLPRPRTLPLTTPMPFLDIITPPLQVMGTTDHLQAPLPAHRCTLQVPLTCIRQCSKGHSSCRQEWLRHLSAPPLQQPPAPPQQPPVLPQTRLVSLFLFQSSIVNHALGKGRTYQNHY